MKMKPYIYAIIVISSLFVSSCGNDAKKTNEDKTTPIAVTVKEVINNSNNPFLTASGKIQAENSADLSTRIMGFVSKVYVNVGDKVRKGQLLIAINNADLQAKRAQVNAGITEATVAYTNAEKDYNRFKNLFADQSASQKELDDMQSRFEMSKARLESANAMKNEINAQFAYSNISAPFSGTITGKSIKEGAMANPGMPLISIESPGRFEVVATIPENEISQIKTGAQVNVVVKSINKIIKGKVTEVSTSAKNTGGQYLVKVALNKTAVAILSGMYVTVQFPIEKQENTGIVLISKEAIITNGQLSGIYTISQSNTALLRWLRLGRDYGDQVEVLSGLSTDESYIISSEGKLFNGAKISIQ